MNTEVTTSKKAATPMQTVTMTDGRIVEFAGKRKMLKSSGKTPDGGLAIRLDFVNGETRTYPIQSDFVEKFACHGAEQKYGDETAGLESVDDMVAAIDSLAERLATGEWNVKREAGDSFSGAGVVVKAMCKVTGKSVEEIKAYLEAKLAAANAVEGQKLSRQALYKAIRASDKFGPTIAAMEAEVASKGPDVTFGDI